MKSYMFILFVTVFFFGCSESKERKAQQLIQQQMELTLQKSDDYKNVTFGKLDSVYTTLLDDTLFMEYNFQRLTYQRFSNVAMTDETDLNRISDRYVKNFLNTSEDEFNFVDSISKYRELEDSIKKQFIPQFTGWSMEYSFRTNNLDEKNGIIHSVYVFDKDITKITAVEDYEKFMKNSNVDEKLKDMETAFLRTFIDEHIWEETFGKSGSKN